MSAPRCDICGEEVGELYECKRCGGIFCGECGSVSDRVCLICRALLQFEADEEKGTEEEWDDEDMEDDEDWEEDELDEDDFEEEFVDEFEGDEAFEEGEDLRKLDQRLIDLRRDVHPPSSTLFL